MFIPWAQGERGEASNESDGHISNHSRKQMRISNFLHPNNMALIPFVQREIEE